MDNSPSRSFRRLARMWLASTVSDPGEFRPRAWTLGNERIVLLDSGHIPAGRSVEAILVVRRSFSCGARCRFLRPIYVGGDCEIGKESRLQAVAVDGSLTLCPSVEVRGWADSAGGMEVRAGCRIGSLAASRTAIRLSLRAETAGVFAPEVLTHSEQDGITEALTVPPRSITELQPPGNERRRPPVRLWGVDPGKLHPLGADTWVYEGSLHFPVPVVLRAHLVTKGAFACPGGSLLEGDVKAGGALNVGPGCVSKGNLTAQGDLVLGAGSVFQGNLRGRQMVRLSTGVRGLRAGGPVEVRAGGALMVEGNVMVRGSLSSRHHVITVPSTGRNSHRRVATGAGT